MKRTQHFLIPSQGNNSTRPQQLRSLYRKLPRHSRRTQNQHSFTRRNLRSPLQRPKRRQSRIEHSRRGHIVHIVRKRKTSHRSHNRPLGHCSVWRSCPREENSGPILEDSNAVRAADHRQLHWRSVMRPARHLPVDRLERRGKHANNDLTLVRLRLRKFLASRSRSNRTQHSSFHKSSQNRR